MPQYAIYFFGDKNKNLIGIGVTFHAPTWLPHDIEILLVSINLFG